MKLLFVIKGDESYNILSTGIGSTFYSILIKYDSLKRSVTFSADVLFFYGCVLL